MNRFVKWPLIVLGGLFLLLFLALLLVPKFVDIQSYKPQIEKRVSKATGRPFTLGGDLRLSLFPWAGISLSDLHLGNPRGFKEKDFITVKSFEVRVKLLPLLFKNIQVKRFVMTGPRIVLERSKEGKASWEGIGKPSGAVSAKPPKGRKKSQEGKELPIRALTVGDFAVTDGSLLWLDRATGKRKEISSLTFRLRDVSLKSPIHIALSARLDGKPLSLEGKVGPLGEVPGKGPVPLNLVLKALNQIEMSIKGKLVDPAVHPKFQLAFRVSPFSPKKLVKALGQSSPVSTADPQVLERAFLRADLKGSTQDISVSGGILELDESKLKFSLKAKDFSRPDLTFQLNLDRIDLDRYLPPPSEKEKGERTLAAAKKKTDYGPLRRMIIDGMIRVGEIRAHGVRLQALYLKITGKNGRFRIDPFTAKMYQGRLSSKCTLNVQNDVPKTSVRFIAKGIQAGLFIKDMLKKDFLVGSMRANMEVDMSGDDAQEIKQTLNGKGNFLFKDGAIVGIDLAGMFRNAKAAFGLTKKGGKKPQTDFAELRAPFSITKGVVNTPNTQLLSPLLRVRARGKANLVDENLDFRVEPKLVASLKGQGGKVNPAGLEVPVLVTGTFSSPKFRPDLKGMMRKALKGGLPGSSELKKIFKAPAKKKDMTRPLEEKAKGLLKGLPLGR